MNTLTLCRADFGFLIQETDEDGLLVNIDHLCGEPTSVRATWTALADVGEREDADDTNAFWQAVDTGIAWLLTQQGTRQAWRACCEAYRGILVARELAEHFRRLRTETVCR